MGGLLGGIVHGVGSAFGSSLLGSGGGGGTASPGGSSSGLPPAIQQQFAEQALLLGGGSIMPYLLGQLFPGMMNLDFGKMLGDSPGIGSKSNPLLDFMKIPGLNLTPFGAGGMGGFNALTGLPDLSLPGLSQWGLYPQQQSVFDKMLPQLLGDTLSRMSGDWANRGLLLPESTAALSGSVVQNILPDLVSLLFPTAGQNILDQLKPGLLREDIMQQRQQKMLQFFQQLLAASTATKSTGAVNAPTQGAGLFSSFGQALGTGLGTSAAGAITGLIK